MPTLPPDIMVCLSAFAPVFSRRVWQHALVLVVGAILAPGPRLVSSVLPVMDLSHHRSFQRYHRVLNRDVWSSLQLGRILLRLVIAAFAPAGPLVFASTGRSSGAARPTLQQPASTVIPSAPVTATW